MLSAAHGVHFVVAEELGPQSEAQHVSDETRTRIFRIPVTKCASHTAHSAQGRRTVAVAIGAETYKIRKTGSDRVQLALQAGTVS